MKVFALQRLALVALGIATARASLLDTQSPVFAKLADIVRPPGDQRASNVDVTGASSAAPAVPSDFGVQWTTVPTNEVRLLDGTLNQGSFALVPTGIDGKPVDKSSPGYAAAVAHSVNRIKAETARIQHAASSKKTDSVTAPGQGQAGSNGTFMPLNPSSIPLVVRGPYLNAWLPSGFLASAQPPNREGNGGLLAGQYPMFWTSGREDGDFRLGIHGYLRIDGQAYQFMGDGFGRLLPAGPNARQISAEYTSTRTIFKFEAGGVHFTVTFLTPVTPADYVRQSIPASYVHFELDNPADVQQKKIQLYMDVDERWATGHDHVFDEYPVKLVVGRQDNTVQYSVSRVEQQLYTEYRQRAEWGEFIFAVEQTPGLSIRNGNNQETQQMWLDKGFLDNSNREVLGPDNAFAYAVDFNVKGAQTDVVFALGHFRTPYLNYVVAAKPGTKSTESIQEDRVGYWTSRFSNAGDAMAFFLSDYVNAAGTAASFDAKVATDSKDVMGGGAVGDQYAAITTLAIRQALSSMEITLPSPKDGGKPRTDDVKIFIKEIESSGRVSTADVIFPLHVLLTYLNPDLLAHSLEPILAYGASGLYPNDWCVHDLGLTFPNATGYPQGDDLSMPVESSADVILMVLHWAKLVGAKDAASYLKKYYSILSQWSSFLISQALIPATQLSTDDFAGTAPNQTSLALKGILGIGAMAHIADIVGQSGDAAIYRNISSSYVPVWLNLGTSSNGQHLKLVYGDDNSWFTSYNLLFDRLLHLGLIPKWVYTMQDKYYSQVRNEYGVPLDSRFNWAKVDWQMFAAATALTTDVRDMFVGDLYKFVKARLTDVPFPDLIETTSGDMPKPPFDFRIAFFARPVVGGVFAPLARRLTDSASNGQGASSSTFAPELPARSWTDEEMIAVLHRGIELGRGLSALQGAPNATQSVRRGM